MLREGREGRKPEYAQRMRAYQARWARINRKRINARQSPNRWARDLKIKYGITLDDYYAMNKKQGGVCAICWQPPKRRVLYVDHCHVTKVVRGLLCNDCNHTLGKFADDPQRFICASLYLEGRLFTA